SAVQAMSNSGSLAGSRTLRSVHPNYADELFAQRLGIEVGAKRTALNLPDKSPQISVPEPGVFRIDDDLNKNKMVVDGELPGLHQRAIDTIKPDDPAYKMQLVVRVKFEQNAADADRLVRVSPGSVRLCANETN